MSKIIGTIFILHPFHNSIIKFITQSFYPSSMAIRLVVFDMAGTTVKDNNNVHAALQKAFEKENILITHQEANEVMGYPKPHAIHALLKEKLIHPSKITLAYIDKIHASFLEEMICFYSTDPTISEKEGVSETFRILKKNNIKVALDTGFDRSIANAILDRVCWTKTGLIDATVTSDEVANGRPYPDMIYRAMQLTGVEDVKEVAKVGDTLSDLQQGNAAGCTYVIGVTTGAFQKEVLAQEPHTHLIGHLPEILPILGLA